MHNVIMLCYKVSVMCDNVKTNETVKPTTTTTTCYSREVLTLFTTDLFSLIFVNARS